ncbi:MBL fold metallo-hydrolase [Metallumcola ferriviriculae]|uniref:MBL fold metallo-hydrolase n=1 Tax=Metallumcola ferriviriculae TaxID=3039180 RepID=A0AAU0UST2_9FIRM|nr:MBL fold metallo-hydrolase [Desulfitibacteraceae bacterium MK1]
MRTYNIPIKHTKCFLVKIDDFYLAIDAGWPGCIHEYVGKLKTLNINPQKIKYLIVTHFHPDHAGLVENIKKSGTRLILFKHQIPYIQVMEKMIRKYRSYQLRHEFKSCPEH